MILADDQCCGVTVEQAAERPGWDALTAVQNGGVVVIDEDIASVGPAGPGLRRSRRRCHRHRTGHRVTDVAGRVAPVRDGDVDPVSPTEATAREGCPGGGSRAA